MSNSTKDSIQLFLRPQTLWAWIYDASLRLPPRPEVGESHCCLRQNEWIGELEESPTSRHLPFLFIQVRTNYSLWRALQVICLYRSKSSWNYFTLWQVTCPIRAENSCRRKTYAVTAVLQLVYEGKCQGNQKKLQTVGNALVMVEWEESSTDFWHGNLTGDGALRRKRVELRDLAKLMVGTLMDSFYSWLLEVMEVEDGA